MKYGYSSRLTTIQKYQIRKKQISRLIFCSYLKINKETVRQWFDLVLNEITTGGYPRVIYLSAIMQTVLVALLEVKELFTIFLSISSIVFSPHR